MEINFNLISFIDLLAFVQGTVLGIILITNHKPEYPTKWLGLYLLTYSAELLLTFFSATGIERQFPVLYLLPFRFYMLSGPLFFLYTASLIRSFRFSDHRKHLIPGLIEMGIWSCLFISSFFSEEVIKVIPFLKTHFMVYHLTAILFSITYAALSVKLVLEHRKKNEEQQAGRLEWVKWVAVFIFSYHLLCMAHLLFPAQKKYLSGIFALVNVIYIYWISIAGLKQRRVKFTKEHDSRSGIKRTVTTDQRFSKINETILGEKLYKDPALSLSTLARSVGLSRNDISYLINKNTGVNFNVFINTYRIEEAKRLLKDASYNHLNMLGIAIESGFNSKATFFAAFKQHTGVSPGIYKTENLQENTV